MAPYQTVQGLVPIELVVQLHLEKEFEEYSTIRLFDLVEGLVWFEGVSQLLKEEVRVQQFELVVPRWKLDLVEQEVVLVEWVLVARQKRLVEEISVL